MTATHLYIHTKKFTWLKALAVHYILFRVYYTDIMTHIKLLFIYFIKTYFLFQAKIKHLERQNNG